MSAASTDESDPGASKHGFFSSTLPPVIVTAFSLGALAIMALFYFGHLGFAPGQTTVIPVRVDASPSASTVTKTLPPAPGRTVEITKTQRVIERQTVHVVEPQPVNISAVATPTQAPTSSTAIPTAQSTSTPAPVETAPVETTPGPLEPTSETPAPTTSLDTVGAQDVSSSPSATGAP